MAMQSISMQHVLNVCLRLGKDVFLRRSVDFCFPYRPYAWAHKAYRPFAWYLNRILYRGRQRPSYRDESWVTSYSVEWFLVRHVDLRSKKKSQLVYRRVHLKTIDHLCYR